MLQRLRGKPIEAASDEDRATIIELSFAYIEPRHRFGLLTDELMDKIVGRAALLSKACRRNCKGAIERYDPEQLHHCGVAVMRQRPVRPHQQQRRPTAAEASGRMVRDILDTAGPL